MSDEASLGAKQKKSHSKTKDDKDKADAPDVLDEDNEFYKKWSGPIILGSFIPALFALITIVGGTLTLNTWTGTCGYPLHSFIQAAIVICYMFLMMYTWIFLGHRVFLQIPFSDVRIVIMRPFYSLKWVMGVYFVLAVTSFIIWCVGSFLLSSAVFCATSSPSLYHFSSFLVVSYWLGFSIVFAYLIKMVLGRDLANMLEGATRDHTHEEVEEMIFRKKFTEFDKERDGVIPVDDMEALIRGVGVYVPDDEIETLRKTLDPKNSGKISYNAMLAWYKQINASIPDVPSSDEDEGPEDE